MVSFNYNASRVTQIQQTVSQKLDRPGDLPRPDQQMMSELLSRQDFATELNAASSIPRRDLPAYLFAWIELNKSIQNQAEDNDIGEYGKVNGRNNLDSKLIQLEEILLKRSSNSFILQVWSVYQQNIDQQFLNSLLIKMAQRITTNNRSRPFISWIRKSAKDSTGNHDLIKQLAELTLNQPDHLDQISQALLDLRQPEIYFPRLKNYSTGISPDCSLPDNKQCLTPVLVYLDIVPDSDFLLSFLLEYFQQASDEKIEVNAELWQYAAKNLPESKQHLIIQAFYRKFRLEEKWQLLNQTIEKVLENRIVFDKLDNRSQQYFRQWQITDKINRHITDQPRKILFYKNYQLQVRQADDFTDDILIVSFGDFFLADNNTEQETVWLLDKVLLEMLQEGGHTDIHQFEGTRKTPTARELIMNKGSSNLVRLQLDDVNILYAHDFIRQQTQKIRPK